jgi:hypothetical protein
MPILSILFQVFWGVLIVFLGFVLGYVFFIRPWHMCWGASNEEIRAPLPGDPFIPAGSKISTRAITINASPIEIWPWLTQLGQERGGFYSYDWLENLFGAQMQNADQLLPAEQHLKSGDRVSYIPDGPPITYATVNMLEPGSILVLGIGWTFCLKPLDSHHTRLVVRYPYLLGKGIGNAFFYYAIFEPAHFVMESGMMMGIKQRAEKAARRRGVN